MIISEDEADASLSSDMSDDDDVRAGGPSLSKGSVSAQGSAISSVPIVSNGASAGLKSAETPKFHSAESNNGAGVPKIPIAVPDGPRKSHHLVNEEQGRIDLKDGVISKEERRRKLEKRKKLKKGASD